MKKDIKEKRNKYPMTMDILDGLYPKGDKERDKAMVFLAYIEMVLNLPIKNHLKPRQKQNEKI